ncbi:MAG: glycosyltransferase family 2 protein [Planctomycetaceae bacterium]|nr:glycosyltransferase family 2 protein [Planctomycetaceae bacterium]
MFCLITKLDLPCHTPLKTRRTHRAIHQVTPQRTEQEFELVVVSQESDAETVAWLTPLQQAQHHFKVLWNEQNIGTAAGRNLGG